ncbi:MAG: RagB/SusD family nutrient uptake outer membrane protein [Proteiniphilum sp.]|uniref:RagB/SusD family nutrient uptake outer membrane protein n=1 Tax=Proteiniphilum sp. TaxID=1926877 RepID=UPI002B2077F6|nr:RagB/SusD family nutrient uptake outer membrane protein [Proteiniphilum sp.]MEA5130000.1 RagB/SusD family nutrient uptake outer membrane protein [Proteiniphilum sp.]
MKKTTIIFIICITGIFSACTDFLQTNPTTEVSEIEFYKTKEDMMMGLYAIMNETQTRLMEVWSYSSLLSDESETGGGLGEGVYKTKWDNFSYDATTCFGYWGYGSWWNEWDFGVYNGVIAANLLIDKLQSSNLDADFVNALSAEARFYRALFYNYLFMGYEQFPLIKGYLPASEMYTVPKGTRQEIYEFMLSDLDDEVTQYLPGREVTVQGRICRDAAKVLRAKIILFHRDETSYLSVLSDMKEIIQSNRYSLNPDYTQLWLKAGEWGPESIYEIAFAGNNTGEGNGLGRSLGGRNIIDPRSAENGGLMEGWGQNTMPSTIYNMFKPGDTRREGTVIVYADEKKKVEEMVTAGQLPVGSSFKISDQQENYEGLGHYKYHPRKETGSDINPLDNYSFSYRFYRYADVLLLAAELEARITGTVSSEGQSWFDQIRDRAFRDNNHRINLTGKSKNEILDILFEERGYEFIDEMQRWFDILRFDKGTKILGHKGWTEKYRYFPIDQSEMDRAQGHLTQNPGWSK